MSNHTRIGLIGLDTNHVIKFTDILNDPDSKFHVPGGRVVAAFPGGRADFELSHSRVKGFTDELREQHVEMLSSPEAVAAGVDMVFIESVHGGSHLDEFKRTLKFRRPTFIDKPFALNLADAKEIFRLAREAGVPVMSSSALRFTDNLVAALKKHEGNIDGCDVFGPMDEVVGLPGMFWYGIHAFEVIVTAMGTGCREIAATKTDSFDAFVLSYGDGRQGVVRGFRRGHQMFGATVHGPKEFEMVNLSASPRPYYASLVEAIMTSLPHGRSAVPEEQTLEVVRLLEAANESRVSGRPVRI